MHLNKIIDKDLNDMCSICNEKYWENSCVIINILKRK